MTSDPWTPSGYLYLIEVLNLLTSLRVALQAKQLGKTAHQAYENIEYCLPFLPSDFP